MDDCSCGHPLAGHTEEWVNNGVTHTTGCVQCECGWPGDVDASYYA